MVSRSGEMCSPQICASSPVLPMILSAPGSTSASRPLRSLAAPVPPARATRRMTRGSAEGGGGSAVAAPPHRAPQGATAAPAEETDARTSFQLPGQLDFRDGDEAEAYPHAIEALRSREDRLDLLALGPGEGERDEAGGGIHRRLGIHPRRARHGGPVQQHRPSRTLQQEGTHERVLVPRAPARPHVAGWRRPGSHEGEELARLMSRFVERAEGEALPAPTSFQAPRPSGSWPGGTSPRAWRES